MNTKFESYISTLKLVNTNLNELIDIDKVLKNIDKIEVHLNALNYIIALDLETFKKRIEILFEENPVCFSVIPILAALRSEYKFLMIGDNSENIIKYIDNVEGIINFFLISGIYELIANNKIRNFVDYATGIEVGLDTNARKNRNGHKIELQLITKLRKHYGHLKEITIHEQHKILVNGEIKKFDCIVENNKNQQTVFIEISYYNAQGSKISETARSYNKLYNEIKNLSQNYHFLWIADGKGIISIKKQLIGYFKEEWICSYSQLIKKIDEYLFNENS